MKNTIATMEQYAPAVLRISMSAVILWFGIQQIIDPAPWTAYVPDAAVQITHMSAIALVHVNAVFELVFGVLLLVGWQTRVVAILLAFHLFDIIYVVGYGEIAVRDFGLAMGLGAVFMQGPDLLCVSARQKEVQAR